MAEGGGTVVLQALGDINHFDPSGLLEVSAVELELVRTKTFVWKSVVLSY